jgi:hypothetical protein
MGAGRSGDDVFIATPQRLAPQAKDGRRAIYDLRVGGGFPAEPEPPAPCDALSTGACQGQAVGAPPSLAPATPGFIGPGNPPATKKHHKHKKKHHKRHHGHHKHTKKHHKKKSKATGKRGRNK